MSSALGDAVYGSSRREHPARQADGHLVPGPQRIPSFDTNSKGNLSSADRERPRLGGIVLTSAGAGSAGRAGRRRRPSGARFAGNTDQPELLRAKGGDGVSRSSDKGTDGAVESWCSALNAHTTGAAVRSSGTTMPFCVAATTIPEVPSTDPPPRSRRWMPRCCAVPADVRPASPRESMVRRDGKKAERRGE